MIAKIFYVRKAGDGNKKFHSDISPATKEKHLPRATKREKNRDRKAKHGSIAT